MNSFSSPYANSLQTSYPSQSEDFVALESGGSIKKQSNCDERSSPKLSNSFTNYFRNGSGQRSNKRYFDGTPQKNIFYCKQKRRSDEINGSSKSAKSIWKSSHNSKQSMVQTNFKEFDFALYFHRSMLEDPWKDLFRRESQKEQSPMKPTECNGDSDIDKSEIESGSDEN